MVVSKFVKQLREKEQPPIVPAVMPLLLVLTIALSAVYLLIGYQSAGSRDFDSASTEWPVITTIQLEKSYQTKVAMIIGDYLSTVNITDGQFLNKTEQLKNQLLALIVPPQYRDSHLALVLSLDKMETEAEKENWPAVTREMEKISQER